MGCSKSTVCYRLYKLGITPRRGLDLNPQEIIKLYQNGYTTTEIAKIMKCSHETIRRILRNNNIDIRKSSESLIIKNTKKNKFKSFRIVSLHIGSFKWRWKCK